MLATSPASGATVHGRLAQVSVTFDEPVDVVPRALTLFTANGAPVPIEPPRLTRGGRLLRAALPHSAAPGGYIAAWRVLADDGHIESGTIRFTVAAAGTGTGSAPTAADSAPPPLTAPEEPVWPVLVAAGLALAAGVGAAVVVRRGFRALGVAAVPYPAQFLDAESRSGDSLSQT